MLTAADLAQFRSAGFVVLRRAFDARPLAAEVDLALAHTVAVGERGFRYVPMMCERTPVSLSLLDHFAAPAAELLDAPVLPVRAKGVVYAGDTAWHHDSGHDLASVGFLAYLDPLDAEHGALRVLPGSQRYERDDTAAGFAIPTEPGDVIAFDEHLYHASTGGRDRRQWRVDYVADRGDDDRLRAYFADVYPPDWDGGYDAERYPSYGAHWRASGRPWIDRLAQLGVYDLVM